MPNIVETKCAQTGKSTQINEFGMRDMQAKAFEKRDAQYLLLKAPPSSGKSRALMFLALDKLKNQGIQKVIVAVPKRSIGGSFGAMDLCSGGFFADWDPKTGCIYIVKSLSRDERIQSIGNLYKIGFSSVPVEERIKDASDEPTYLMAPVSIVSTFECYNFNPRKLEQLLHNFFGSSCLNLDIFDAKNQRHSPREWFIVPLPIIEKAVELIIDGGIVNYKYDAKQEKIVLK